MIRSASTPPLISADTMPDDHEGHFSGETRSAGNGDYPQRVRGLGPRQSACAREIGTPEFGRPARAPRRPCPPTVSASRASRSPEQPRIRLRMEWDHLRSLTLTLVSSFPVQPRICVLRSASCATSSDHHYVRNRKTAEDALIEGHPGDRAMDIPRLLLNPSARRRCSAEVQPRTWPAGDPHGAQLISLRRWHGALDADLASLCFEQILDHWSAAHPLLPGRRRRSRLHTGGLAQKPRVPEPARWADQSYGRHASEIRPAVAAPVWWMPTCCRSHCCARAAGNPWGSLRRRLLIRSWILSVGDTRPFFGRMARCTSR